jgi:hypothetical protein
MADHFKIRVWAVIGDGDTGKSTVIGHLISQLGQGSGGLRQVLLRGGGIFRFTRVGSPFKKQSVLPIR